MYLSTQELEKRGWTKGLIKKFLPEPDDVEHFKRYGCRYFYSIKKVEETERSDKFRALQEKALKKRTAGKLSAEKRRNEYLRFLSFKMLVRVRVLDEETLLDRAISAYNSHRRMRDWQRFERGQIDDYELENRRDAGTDSDPAFLERITVNYIRHRLTRYDALLESLPGQQAQEEAARIIQTRVFEAIIAEYPAHRDECERQMIERGLLKPFDRQTRQPVLFI